jgi:hypothetical protein
LGEDSESSESKPNNENFEFTSYEDVGKFWIRYYKPESS